jgi:hypothetical protein
MSKTGVAGEEMVLLLELYVAKQKDVRRPNGFG